MIASRWAVASPRHHREQGASVDAVGRGHPSTSRMLGMTSIRVTMADDSATGIQPGRPDDQRHVDDRVVEAGVVEPGVVLGHVLAVIAEHDHHGVLEEAQFAQVLEDPADLEVEVGHLGVVEIGDEVEVGHGVEEVVEVPLEQRVARPALQLRGDQSGSIRPAVPWENRSLNGEGGT